MAGYWPSSFLCVFICMDRDEVDVHKLAKKEQRQCLSTLTEQYRIYYMAFGKIFVAGYNW